MYFGGPIQSDIVAHEQSKIDQSSTTFSDLSELPDEFRNEIINIITKKVQEEIRLGNIDPNEIGPDGKTIMQRLRDAF